MTRKQLEDMNETLIVVSIILAVGVIVLTIAGNPFENKLKEPIIFHEDLYESLIKIQNNCGSTYITPCEYPKNELCVFTRTERADGFSKYDYIPIEECLK